jgi:hypothetical protein
MMGREKIVMYKHTTIIKACHFPFLETGVFFLDNTKGIVVRTICTTLLLFSVYIPFML